MGVHSPVPRHRLDTGHGGRPGGGRHPETDCVRRAPGQGEAREDRARISAAGSGAQEAHSKLQKTNVHSAYTDKTQNLIVMIKDNDL